LWLAIAFFGATGVLLWLAWSARSALMPTAESEWRHWLLFVSPFGVSLQFGAGVAAWRLSRLALPAVAVSNAGGVGLVAVHAINVTIGLDAMVSGLLTAIAAAAVMIGGKAPSLTNRLLATPALLYVGTISYSLYLFHFVVPALTMPPTRTTFDATAIAVQAFNLALTLLLAIALATGIYRLVEVPGRRVVRALADRLLEERSPKAQAAE
jgi:peptidoglycan/LPS O-acetylase OafA/YrhL